VTDKELLGDENGAVVNYKDIFQRAERARESESERERNERVVLVL
jgi:hypothetical protein